MVCSMYIVVHSGTKQNVLPNAEILSSLVLLSKSVWHTVAKRVLAKVLASGFPYWHVYKTRSKNSDVYMVLLLFPMAQRHLGV